MTTLKKTLHDKSYEEATEAFAYIMATTRLDWDLAFLGEHLIDQIIAWRVEYRATHPLVDERPASPAIARPPSLFVKPPTIPPPPPEVHPELFIEDDSKPVVRATESDESVKQIDNPDCVLDCQEESGPVLFLLLDLVVVSCKSSKWMLNIREMSRPQEKITR